NDETKKYAVEAARRVKAHDGVLHFFAGGRVFEQAKGGWLKENVQAGGPVGKHTYDHVKVRAERPEENQFRLHRSPWLIEGMSPADVIRENIRVCSAAMKTRLGIEPAGFRTPGGFSDGLRDRPDVQAMLQELGYSWVSSLYPSHLVGDADKEPDA